MNYVYRFLNEENDIIYVGRTDNLKGRMAGHFSGGHLSAECYKEVKKIEFIELNNRAEMYIKERYYIDIWRPKWNIKGVNDDVIMKTFIPEIYTWKEYKKEKCVLPFNKKILNSRLNVRVDEDIQSITKQCCKELNIKMEDYVINCLHDFLYTEGIYNEEYETKNRSECEDAQKNISIRLPNKTIKKVKDIALNKKVTASDIIEKMLIKYCREKSNYV